MSYFVGRWETKGKVSFSVRIATIIHHSGNMFRRDLVIFLTDFDFREMKKGNGCNSCSHPTCPYSLITNGVCNCAECEYGVLVLDPSSGPKWKLGCNRYGICLFTIYSYHNQSNPCVEVCFDFEWYITQKSKMICHIF